MTSKLSNNCQFGDQQREKLNKRTKSNGCNWWHCFWLSGRIEFDYWNSISLDELLINFMFVCVFHFRRIYSLRHANECKSSALKIQSHRIEIFYLSANLNSARKFILNENEGHSTKCHAINVITTQNENAKTQKLYPQ